MDKKLKFKKAFSLTEIMLVLAIMAILASLLNVNIKSKREDVEIKNIIECVKIYEAAVQMYYLHNSGTFPTVTSGAKLETIGELDRFRPENFNTDRLIKSGSCQSLGFYISGVIFDINVTLNTGTTNFRNKIVKVLKEHCSTSQVASGTNYIYYYLRDNSSNIYI